MTTDIFSKRRMQNRHDTFSAMYMFIAHNILEYCGKRIGEGICREAVRRTGHDFGKYFKGTFGKENLKINLKNFFYYAFYFDHDPRFHIKHIADEEERQIIEVYTCPLATYWNSHQMSKEGSFFCEEFQYACILALTDGKGQLCLTNSLTCPRDNYCKFSSFFRETNLDRAEVDQSFTNDSNQLVTDSRDFEVDFKQCLSALSIGLYHHLLEVAIEVSGQEGKYAVIKGLEEWAHTCVYLLQDKATKCLVDFDMSFIQDNLVISTNSSEDDLWEYYECNESRELMQTIALDYIIKHTN